MSPSVAFILINYNTINHTIECLDSLNNIESKFKYKVYIVDNNSNDDCDFYLNIIKDKLKYPIQLINSNENLGFSGGCKVGVDAAMDDQYEFILLLNNDTIVEPNFLDELIKPYYEKENVGITTCKILDYYNNSLMQYNGADINLYKGTSEIYGFGQSNINNPIKPVSCSFASGCCMLIDVNTIKKYGFMDDNYFLYYEDVEYCYRLKKHGLDIIYVPTSIIYHKESVSTNKKSLLYSYYFSRNRLTFIKDNLEQPYKLISYVYTYCWLVKKVLCNELILKGVIIGLFDSFKNIKGKKVI